MVPTALIVGDVQNGILGMALQDKEKQDEYLGRLLKVINAARKAGVLIIYITVGFRPGHPEISPHNYPFAGIKKSGGFILGEPSTQVHATVAPQEGDLTIIKHRWSAFSGTELEVVLRSHGVQNLVLTGISTSGVILSTLRHAADMDYEITVLKDLCIDPKPEVHNVLVESVFPSQAAVREAEAWVSEL